MSKQRNIKRDARRAKPQAACGHASRYRNKLGCVICRRENGATIAAPPNAKRKRREEQARERELIREAQKLAIDLSGVKAA